jgi:hypothetical protein
MLQYCYYFIDLHIFTVIRINCILSISVSYILLCIQYWIYSDLKLCIVFTSNTVILIYTIRVLTVVVAVRMV